VRPRAAAERSFGTPWARTAKTPGCRVSVFAGATRPGENESTYRSGQNRSGSRAEREAPWSSGCVGADRRADLFHQCPLASC
jgi:hypothetical protein